ncbi:60S ribosomal protein L31 [Candidatus Woesearchaeota archaeon]|nr:60S ribosomal protein L31 [Candidatus Woesearchaeota archaeon]
MATKKESKSSLERDYVIPLRKGIRKVVAHKKTPRAIREIKAFLAKHTKAKDVKLGMMLNLELWKNGIKNPPTKVKVHVVVKDGIARAELFGHEFKEAVKAVKKDKGPETLKDKIEKKLGVDDKAAAREARKEETRSSEAASAKKAPEAPSTPASAGSETAPPEEAAAKPAPAPKKKVAKKKSPAKKEQAEQAP